MQKIPNKIISIDEHPWKHPFLTTKNLERFKLFSKAIWEFALKYFEKRKRPLKCAFAVNMAQNMYKWAKLIKKWGYNVDLYLHPLDHSAISLPEWEEFDGEYENIFDGNNFLKSHPEIKTKIPYFKIKMEGSNFFEAYQEFHRGNYKYLLKMLTRLSIRPEVLISYEGLYPYYKWVKELAKYDVIYIASSPIAAYASGVPYCALSVGGDLQYDCGRGDDYGKIMLLSFNAAKFLIVTNPHPLAHCRRLGLTNALFLPYIMDDSEYSPGEGKSRYEWEKKYEKGIYILVTSRIDSKFKGYNENLFQVLINIAKRKQDVKFIFLNWGKNIEDLKSHIDNTLVNKQFIILPTVGKKRIIDYYRSCDIVMDHFAYGYYGATMLEAASIGKPIVMKLREEHYNPLYEGDIPPIMNVNSSKELYNCLLVLIENHILRKELGTKLRKWLVRNHGKEKTIPLLLSILTLTADRIHLPKEIEQMNPLLDKETEQEKSYHLSCQTKI